LVGRWIHELSFKFLLNHINLNTMGNVMAILLGLCRINYSCAQLCSSPILGTLRWELYFVLWMRLLRVFLIFSYWGFIAWLELGGERYRFSKVGLQTVIWRKKENMTFGNTIRSFYIIMDIAKKLQSLVSSWTLIMYRSSNGLENWVTWASKWNLRSGESKLKIGVYQTKLGLYELSWTPILLFALNLLLFISGTSKSHIRFISINVLSLSPQLFHFWSILLQFILLQV